MGGMVDHAIGRVVLDDGWVVLAGGLVDRDG